MPSEINAGGSDFKLTNFDGKKSHSLSSSAPLTISPTLGKKIRLVGLASTGANVTGASISVGGVVKINNKTLVDGPTDDGQFFIASTAAAGTGSIDSYIGGLPHIDGDVDEDIVISTTSGTTVLIEYAFAEGE